MEFTGIGLALLAATAYNAGLVLEKRALQELPAIDVRHAAALAKILLTSPQWLAGFALSLSGLACQVLVLTFEPVTVVQPVLACGVVVVLLLSRMVLREHLGHGELGCVAVMAVAIVFIAMSGGGSATGVGHDAATSWIIFAAVPSCLVGMLVSANALRAASRKHRAPVIGVSYGVGTGLLYGVAALAIKALSAVLVHHHGAAAALAIVASPYLYMMAGCIAAGFVLFQTALQRCRASIVVPVSNITGSVYFMAAGTWLFREHLPEDPGKLALRLTGIAVAGLVLIVLPRQATATQPVSPLRRIPLPSAVAVHTPGPPVAELVQNDIRAV